MGNLITIIQLNYMSNAYGISNVWQLNSLFNSFMISEKNNEALRHLTLVCVCMCVCVCVWGGGGGGGGYTREYHCQQ